MAPKKRRVDKNMVKFDLATGKSPGEIAKVWGVSRQYISSIRQELVKEGVVQRGRPGRPKRSYSFEYEKDLELTDIERFCKKTKSLILKMWSLEMERDHYKLVYEYVFDKLCEHISEEEKQYVVAMTGHNYIGKSPPIHLEDYERAIKLINEGGKK